MSEDTPINQQVWKAANFHSDTVQNLQTAADGRAVALVPCSEALRRCCSNCVVMKLL